ncbi:hypothetical protein GLOIN_2v1631338, partial [Rhizophagus irregularis DAOM 181602=DAOM 197198]
MTLYEKRDYTRNSFKVYSNVFRRLYRRNKKTLMGKFKVARRAAEARSHDGQERQKNEQIRKISQEVEKTRSELKKVKTGVNKEFDQLKKSKKGRSTSNRRKREEILEIPVLPENVSNDQQAKEA